MLVIRLPRETYSRALARGEWPLRVSAMARAAFPREKLLL